MRKLWLSIVWILLIVLSVGCGDKPALSQEQSNNLSIKKEGPAIIKEGPAPRYLEWTITSEREEYKQGETVSFVINIKNVWSESLHISNTPNILVGSATEPTNKYDHILIPNLSDKTIQPGETIRSTATWTQSGKPGLYQVEFGDIVFDHSTVSGGGKRFFVKYPPDAVQIKTIEHEVKTQLPTEKGELTFVLKRIEMNEHETKVYFDFLTDLEAPLGFQMSLARSAGNSEIAPEPNIGDEQSVQKNGVIQGLAKFNPVTKDATKLHIIISDWSVIYKGVKTEVVKGPWIIDVPLQ
jgi:hypothetical protein